MILNGRRLRRIRERARKTLMDVAIEARSGGLPKCSPALISQWETGLHNPTHPEYVVGILAKILEVDPAELTKGDTHESRESDGHLAENPAIQRP